MDVAIRMRPRKMDHLKQLITKHLESLDLSGLNYYQGQGKDVDKVCLLLKTAALRHSVIKYGNNFTLQQNLRLILNIFYFSA